MSDCRRATGAAALDGSLLTEISGDDRYAEARITRT
jgi:hypothetical protein